MTDVVRVQGCTCVYMLIYKNEHTENLHSTTYMTAHAWFYAVCTDFPTYSLALEQDRLVYMMTMAFAAATEIAEEY